MYRVCGTSWGLAVGLGIAWGPGGDDAGEHSREAMACRKDEKGRGQRWGHPTEWGWN